MELTTEIFVRKTPHSKIRDVDFENLEFGKYVSDHMLICDYKNGEWFVCFITSFSPLN